MSRKVFVSGWAFGFGLHRSPAEATTGLAGGAVRLIGQSCVAKPTVATGDAKVRRSREASGLSSECGRWSGARGEATGSVTSKTITLPSALSTA